MVIRHDEIGRLVAFGNALQSPLVRADRDHSAAPAPKQAAHAIPNQGIVVDEHHKLGSNRIKGCGSQYRSLGWFHVRRHVRDGNGKPRSFSNHGAQADWMIKQPAKALHDGETKTQAAAAILVELAQTIE